MYKRQVSQEIFAIFARYAPVVEPLSIDEAFLDLTGMELLMESPRAYAEKLKAEIREKTGLIASVGIAPNKFLAKLASDLEKPDGLVIITEQTKQAVLDPLPVSRIWGVGQKTAARLEDLRIRTIGQLRRTPRERLARDLGAHMADHLLALASGIDTRPVAPREPAKSIGKEVTFPEDGYHGQDIIDTAQRIIDRDGDKYLALSEEERLAIFKDLAYHEKLAILKEDLERFHVTFDNWFSERTLHPDAVRKVVEILKEKGDIYEKEGALWLKSTAYGDDKDRVVIRDNGVPTYLAADIAYHHNKYERGFDRLINIWGADHHGYVCRVKAAMQALGHDPEKLTVLLLQMVSLYRGGELVKMSKRTGQSVTLNELMEEVGTDAARYFFLMRSLDSQLDFDLDLAKKKSNDNPVYYIQYAHARICSIFRQAEETKLALGKAPHLELLTDESEVALIKKIEEYPEEVAKAAADYAPQRIARYSYDLAALFHSFYNKCRIMGVDHDLAEARLALVTVTAHVIRHSLGILGVSAPEHM